LQKFLIRAYTYRLFSGDIIGAAAYLYRQQQPNASFPLEEFDSGEVYEKPSTPDYSQSKPEMRKLSSLKI
jgi:hypothetical protein